MNRGSISIDRQSDTHAPHWMQAIVWVTSTMFSCGTMYSRSGTGSLLIRYGVTRWIFFQCTASMSTIRSRITGMLPIGSTSITSPPPPSPPCAGFQPVACILAAASSRCVLQARPGLPFIRTPHDPQIACWHEHRIPTEPSTSSRILRIASSTELVPTMSTLCSSQYAASPDCGSNRRILNVYSGIGSVAPFLGLPTRNRDRRVAHLWHIGAVGRDVDVLEPLGVVALREVGAELGSAGFCSLLGGDDDRLGNIEHVAQLDRADHILVEDRPVVVDHRVGSLLLELPDDLMRLAEAVGVTEHGAVLVHLAPQLLLDRRYAATAGLAVDDRVEVSLDVGHAGRRRGGHRHLHRVLGRVLARTPTEDQRVEQRVGAQPVAAMDRDAGDFAGRIQPGNRRLAVDVGLDPAHDVVLTRADVDRLAGDVDAGKVLADVDDFP